jgi:hypothetical protein
MKAARRAKYEAKLKAASGNVLRNASQQAAIDSGNENAERGISVPDIETLAGADNGTRESPTVVRNYVLELEGMLQAKLAERGARGERLQHVDFSTATSGLNSSKLYPTFGKCRIIHVYRTLVHEGLLEHTQQIADLLVRKLGRSSYGGVNLSVFIPPGHSAPIWDVSAVRTDSNIRISVTKQRTVYTLRGYVDYSHQKPGSAVLCSPGHCAESIEDAAMTLAPTPGSTVAALFELALDVAASPDTMAEGEAYAGTLRGSDPLKTCTFGCIYCPTEVDAEGEQINPKSYCPPRAGARELPQRIHSKLCCVVFLCGRRVTQRPFLTVLGIG